MFPLFFKEKIEEIWLRWLRSHSQTETSETRSKIAARLEVLDGHQPRDAGGIPNVQKRNGGKSTTKLLPRKF